ncbi:GAF domain-containing protein [Niveibacterium sp. COAC-50]|uniref:GAF domain-containing protein n=1 Tax=Niveibacterium sp. COAC-50 TaxID=2729384 RepID=UPI0015543C9E|nr:GAF domain-containing protein [Niveibacterium sp. COAC-50]
MIQLEAIRGCLEGSIPAVLATASADGTPNVTYVSQMHYVDPRHVALSFQFFNKTRENILANPRSTALVIDPISGESFHIELLYLRTETEGALFQHMKAKLAGIASHSGMVGVFRLQGADVYRVLGVERIPGPVLPNPQPRRNLLNAMRSASARIAACVDLDGAVDAALDALASDFGIEHSMLLFAEEACGRLYTVASRGYPVTGVGSEIAYGDGVIGVAAQYRTPIRINHMTMEYSYGRAALDGAGAHPWPLETQIPFPGLPEPHSQLAVPVLAHGRLLGVLCVESPQDLRFTYDDEDALVALATQLGSAIHALQQQALVESAVTEREARPAAPLAGQALEVRHYAANDSIFIGGDYLIKGVAGAILWCLLQTRAATGREDFSNRELRVSPDLRLPEISDNLEARLILLQRRLDERNAGIRLRKTGRGLFRLEVDMPLDLRDL